MTKWTDRLDMLVKSDNLGHKLGELLKLPTVDSWAPGQVKTHWKVHNDYLSINGTLFGGCLTAIADQVASHAAFTVISDDEFTRTIELTTSFFHAITQGQVDIVGTIDHKSRQLIHSSVSFTNNNQLCTVARVIIARVQINEK